MSTKPAWVSRSPVQRCIGGGTLLLTLFVLGCGNPRGTVPVSGTVTLNGEQPPGAGTVTFTVIEPAEGFTNRPAMAKFDSTGRYEATSFEPGDGLLPGKYAIAVECYETPPNMEGKPVKSHIARKYLDPSTSGFELEIAPQSRRVTYDLKLED